MLYGQISRVEAYRQVRVARIDEQTITEFEKKLKADLYKVGNWTSSGSGECNLIARTGFFQLMKPHILKPVHNKEAFTTTTRRETMAKSYYSTVFEQTANEVWAVIRDFNSYPNYI